MLSGFHSKGASKAQYTSNFSTQTMSISDSIILDFLGFNYFPTTCILILSCMSAISFASCIIGYGSLVQFRVKSGVIHQNHKVFYQADDGMDLPVHLLAANNHVTVCSFQLVQLLTGTS